MPNTPRLSSQSSSHSTAAPRSLFRGSLNLWALVLYCLTSPALANDSNRPADSTDFGNPHPDLVEQLRPFAFLVGSWQCSGKVLAEDGIFEPLDATLVGRYILGGRAIEDVYRQFDRAGELQHFGVTYRSYDREGKRWAMKFHDALASTWLDLGPIELGGVEVTDDTISYQYRLDTSGVVRVTFSDISAAGFDWRAELSSDNGANWREVMTMRASPAGKPAESTDQTAPGD